MKNILHLVSFDIPYPPNYGGIIDVFFKIKELHKQGVEIYLHVYIFDDKAKEPKLKEYCKEVFYYQRSNTLVSIFSILPFRIKSRSSRQLLINLTAINAPILFEGLHTTFPITKNKLKRVYVRTHNIEHNYFFGLSKSEENIFKKIFYYIEALKLKKFEKHLKNVDGILTISPFEQNYFLQKYPKKSFYIPVFHAVKKLKNVLNIDKFVLYHGDLRVSDNVKSVLNLIDTYKNTAFKFVVASSYQEKKVISEIRKYHNIIFNKIPSQKELDVLLEKAHVNTLFTYQKTGIKLKLLNTLYQGKHIIANTKMVEETGLESLCEVENTKKGILKKTAALFTKEYTETQIIQREEKLAVFNPEKAAEKLIDIIFRH
jgi:glycosyltransferase involved in cell wall biosynthesis